MLASRDSKLARALLELANIDSAQAHQILSVALAVCDAESGRTPPDAVFRLAGQMGPLLSNLPASARGRITRSLFARSLASCPPAALGSVTESIAEELLAKLGTSESSDLQVFANFVIAFNSKLLSLRQWNVIAEKAASKLPQLAYKPFNDGAAHWTVAVDRRLIATVSELDDTVDSFAATFCLAAGLCGVGAAYLDALGVTTLPRREATVQVITCAEFVTLMRRNQRPRQCKVILDDHVQLGPHDSLNNVTVATYLLSRALYEMARHLLKGKVTEVALIRRLRPILQPFYC